MSELEDLVRQSLRDYGVPDDTVSVEAIVETLKEEKAEVTPQRIGALVRDLQAFLGEFGRINAQKLVGYIEREELDTGRRGKDFESIVISHAKQALGQELVWDLNDEIESNNFPVVDFGVGPKLEGPIFSVATGNPFRLLYKLGVLNDVRISQGTFLPSAPKNQKNFSEMLDLMVKFGYLPKRAPREAFLERVKLLTPGSPVTPLRVMLRTLVNRQTVGGAKEWRRVRAIRDRMLRQVTSEIPKARSILGTGISEEMTPKALSEADREIEFFRKDGLPSPKLIELLEKKSGIGLLEEKPLTSGQKAVFGAISIIQVANDFLIQIGELKTLQKLNLQYALGSLKWWLDRGVVPAFYGYVYHRLKEDEIIADRKKIKELLKDEGLDALLLKSITDESNLIAFGKWAVSHVKNFDDYYNNFVRIAIPNIRYNSETKMWEMRTWDWQGGFTGAGQIFNWVPNEGLTKVMNALFQQVVEGTNRDLQRLWEERKTIGIVSPSTPVITAAESVGEEPGYIVEVGGAAASMPIAPARPIRKVRLKKTASDKGAYSLSSQYKVTEWKDDSPLFYEVEQKNVPEGYIAVIGADYNTYSSIGFNSSAGPIVLLKKESTQEVPEPKPLGGGVQSGFHGTE